ncbi:MAG: YbaB/EbfC family nucleoid-associated protein [Clostridia bacterium]|nr:YbaB/EbfC family nucleoid-associated protein [Clostridia bacterium]
MGGYKGFGGGGFGGGFNMQNLMKQAQKMQEDMEKAKEELLSKEFTAKSGGGMVEVVMTGDKKLKNIIIKKEIVDPDDVEMLQDLIIAAMNDAVTQIEKIEKENSPAIPGM